MCFLKYYFGYLSGYVRITVEGYFVERFMNICISKKILLWKTKRDKSTIIHANVSINDFRRIREVAKTTKCKVNIKQKKGLPFVLYRYKKRKLFLGFFLLLIIGLGILSNFIWNIDITCNEEINQEEIKQLLNKNGLIIGTPKSKIEVTKIVNAIRYEREDIAWVGINIKGTNAVVEIVKATEKPEILDENELCNIVSNKEGIITKIDVYNGTANVKVGDLVKQGTILINGWMEGKYTGIRYVAASGEITAKVWYSKKMKLDKTTDIYSRTGEQENKYQINFNNFKINLYKTLSKFKNYDTIEETKKLKLFSNFYLPIELIKLTNYETQKETVTYSLEELKQMHTERLMTEIEKEIENKESIINRQVNVLEYDTYVEIEVVVETIENIGAKEKLVF